MSSGTIEVAESRPLEGQIYDRPGQFQDWVCESDWQDEFKGSLVDFAVAFQGLTGLSLRQTGNKLRVEDSSVLVRILLERFIAEPFSGQSPVNDFLRAGGPAVDLELIDYLKGVESSSRSFYEVLSIGPDSNAVLKDHLNEDAPKIEVELDDSWELGPGSFILGRVIRIGDRPALTNATIEVPRSFVMFASGTRDSGSRRSNRARTRSYLAELDEEMREDLFNLAVFTWVVAKAMDVEGLASEFDEELEDALNPFSLAFPIRVSRIEIRSNLHRIADFEKCCDNGWNWVPDFRQRNPQVKAKVHFCEDHLIVEADSNNHLKAIKARLSSVLGRRIGKPIPADREFWDSIDREAEQSVEDKISKPLPDVEITLIDAFEAAVVAPQAPESTRPRQLQLQLDLR